MPKTVFVTGASGFAGSHLAGELVRRGHRVRALVRPTSKLDALSGLEIEYVHGDLADGALPEAALHGVDTVYNVAAVYRKEGVPEQYFYEVNEHGTERLLKAALQAEVQRFVHISTAGVHGEVKNGPATETSAYNPGDAYQRSKLAGELRALKFFREYGLRGVVIRPTGMYGPGDMRFLKLFRAIDKGSFWMIGDGKTTYHLVYIDDLVEGTILAAERGDISGEVFLIGGDEYFTITRLVHTIGEVIGRPVPQRHLPAWPVMLAATVCQQVCRPLGIEPPLYPRRLGFFMKNRAFDISKAKQVLGFKPKVDLRTGLSRTAEWYRQNGLLR